MGRSAVHLTRSRSDSSSIRSHHSAARAVVEDKRAMAQQTVSRLTVRLGEAHPLPPSHPLLSLIPFPLSHCRSLLDGIPCFFHHVSFHMELHPVKRMAIFPIKPSTLLRGVRRMETVVRLVPPRLPTMTALARSQCCQRGIQRYLQFQLCQCCREK